MAYVKPHRNRIAYRFRIDGEEFTTTVDCKPTATNIKAAKKEAEHAEYRLKLGESWESVRAELRGERVLIAKSLGYYAQFSFDNSLQIRDTTLRQYESLYHIYWKAFERRAVTSLLPSELLAHLNSFDVSQKTKRNALSVLRIILGVAKDDKVLIEIPISAKWDFSTEEQHDPDPYSENERDALLNALLDWPVAWRYFLMGFHTGMRTGEMLALEWKGVIKPYIKVMQGRSRRKVGKTKTGKHREIICPDIVLDMLDVNPSRFKKSFVHLSVTGVPILDEKYLMAKWREAHKNAKVRLRVGVRYPWRATYVSLALAAGAPPIWVAKQTGHNIATLIKHYARWIKDRKKQDIEELEKIYG